MISIRNEINDVVEGNMDKNNNPLKNAPHTAEYSLSEKWNHPYSRKDACFLENGKKNINIGHQLVELITLLEIEILFAPVHQLKNTLTSIIKFYYFGCFTNNPIFN